MVDRRLRVIFYLRRPSDFFMDWETYRNTQRKINNYYANKIKEYRQKRDLYLRLADSSRRDAEKLFQKKKNIENGPHTPWQNNRVSEYATEGAHEQNKARRRAQIARYFDNKAAKYSKILYEREERFPYHVPPPPWEFTILPPATDHEWWFHERYR